jgi:hypothetical protein
MFTIYEYKHKKESLLSVNFIILNGNLEEKFIELSVKT